MGETLGIARIKFLVVKASLLIGILLIASSPSAAAQGTNSRNIPRSVATNCPPLSVTPGSDVKSELHPTGYSFNSQSAPRLDFIENEYELPTPICQSGLTIDKSTGLAISPPAIDIPVYFTNLGTTTGSVQAQEQLTQLNTDFTGTNITFSLAGYQDITDPALGDSSNLYPLSQLDTQIRTQYRQGGYGDLNVYIAPLNPATMASWGGLNAWSTMPVPNSTSSEINTDGIVIDQNSIGPGHKQLTRNVGYWLGLYRPWHNGQTPPGDYVADTVPMTTPWYQCTIPPGFQNLSPTQIAELDNNLMEFTPGTCRQKFTPDQSLRMEAIYLALRTAPFGQGISFTSTPQIAPTVGSSYLVTAIGGGSGGNIDFSASPSNICTIRADRVTFVGVGKCVIDANQLGNQNYLPAQTVQQVITVSQTSPAAPILDNPISVTTNSLTLTWTPSNSSANSPATSFNVFEGTAPAKESTTPVTCSTPLTATSTSCTVTGLNPSATYHFTVEAKNGAGNSIASNEVSTTTATSAPAAPHLSNPTSVTANSLTLTWTPSNSSFNSPATSFNVFEGTAPAKESTTPVTCSTPLTATSTSCTVTGLNPSTTYYFTVEAKNTAGNSIASNEVSTTTATPIQSPSVLANPGYYIAANDGGVFTYGSANFYGSLANTHLNKPIVGITSTPDGKGYWLVASDGGVFSFGDATFYGSTGNMILNKPIVGITSTPDGKGYWLVASDGGVFSFGDATFYGSTGNMTLNKPIVGITATPDGKGYWLVASDGGVFSFGDATFLGSAANLNLNQPVVSIKSVVLA